MAISPTNASRCWKNGDFGANWEGWWLVGREAMMWGTELEARSTRGGEVESEVEDQSRCVVFGEVGLAKTTRMFVYK